jgi:hyperosmotically inducible periplasmic protein
MRSRLYGAVLSLSGVVLLAGAQIFLVSVPNSNAQAGSSQADNNIHAEVANSLKKSDFQGVRISVSNGIVDLEGTVKNFDTKVDAEKRVNRIKQVQAVRNQLKIAGAGEVPDQKLQQQIIQKLQYDRVGYGNAFNAISVNVNNGGVATLGGHALGPVAADSALSLVSRFPGVTDVINNISIDPLSPMDDRSRLQLYRAIYGFPQLNKYALDPAQPIRIVVANGHVILEGVVLSQADKDIAGIRAKSVPGIFSVTNNLQVANQPSEKK